MVRTYINKRTEQDIQETIVREPRVGEVIHPMTAPVNDTYLLASFGALDPSLDEKYADYHDAFEKHHIIEPDADFIQSMNHSHDHSPGPSM